MIDVQETLSMEEWCVLAYRAWHVGDPRARLGLARLYNGTNIQHNTRYALFWLLMARESFLLQEEDPVIEQKVEEEISAVEGQLSKEVVHYVRSTAGWMSEYSFGVSEESAPSDVEISEHYYDLFYV